MTGPVNYTSAKNCCKIEKVKGLPSGLPNGSVFRVEGLGGRGGEGEDKVGN
jgi:hypothetical protein